MELGDIWDRVTRDKVEHLFSATVSRDTSVQECYDALILKKGHYDDAAELLVLREKISVDQKSHNPSLAAEAKSTAPLPSPLKTPNADLKRPRLPDSNSSGHETDNNSKAKRVKTTDESTKRCKILPDWWLNEHIRLPTEIPQSKLCWSSCSCAEVSGQDQNIVCTGPLDATAYGIRKEIYEDIFIRVCRFLDASSQSSPVTDTTVVLQSATSEPVHYLDAIVEQLCVDLGAARVSFGPSELTDFAADLLREKIYESPHGSLLRLSCMEEEAPPLNPGDIESFYQELLERAESFEADEHAFARKWNGIEVSSDIDDPEDGLLDHLSDCSDNLPTEYHMRNIQFDKREEAFDCLIRKLPSAADLKGSVGMPAEVNERRTPAIQASQYCLNPPGGLIIHVREIDTIRSNDLGCRFIERLETLIQLQRVNGKNVMLIGTMLKKETTFAATGLFKHNIKHRCMVISSPLCTKQEQFAKSGQQACILESNARLLKAMFRSAVPASRDMTLFSPGIKWDLTNYAAMKAALSGSRISFNSVRHIIEKLEWKFSVNDPIGLDELADAISKVDLTSISDTPDQIKHVISRNEKHGVSGVVAEPRKSSVNLEMIKILCNEHEKALFGGVLKPESINTTFEDVELDVSITESLDDLTTLPLQSPEDFKYGLLAKTRISGALLYGPPGTGKTLLARALAHRAATNVLTVSGADVFQQYVGEGEKVVRAIFTLGRKLSPCIVFIDEGDNMFQSRSAHGTARYDRSILNEFLQQWDGIATNMESSLTLLVATNRPFDIDAAVLRRLPRRLFLDLPSTAARQKIMEILLREENLAEDVDLAYLATLTDSYSGSELKNLCLSAALKCVRENAKSTAEETKNQAALHPAKRVLRKGHFEYALSQISPSVDRSMLARIRKFDREFGMNA